MQSALDQVARLTVLHMPLHQLRCFLGVSQAGAPNSPEHTQRNGRALASWSTPPTANLAAGGLSCVSSCVALYYISNRHL